MKKYFFIVILIIFIFAVSAVAGSWTSYQTVISTQRAYTGILIKHTNENPDGCSSGNANSYVYLELKDEIDYLSSTYAPETIYKTSIEHSIIYDDTICSKYSGTKMKYYISGCSNGYPCVTKGIGDTIK